MTDKDKEARDAILDEIVRGVGKVSARDIRELAEAWAWLTSPYQGHGSPAVPK